MSKLTMFATAVFAIGTFAIVRFHFPLWAVLMWLLPWQFVAAMLGKRDGRLQARRESFDRA